MAGGVAVFFKRSFEKAVGNIIAADYNDHRAENHEPFSSWIFGAMLRAVPEFKVPKFFLPLTLVVFGVAVIYGSWAKNIYGEYATGVLFGGIILCWRSMSLPNWPTASAFWKCLAAFSFSLYAIHYPVMKVLIELLNRHAGLGARNATAGIADWLKFGTISGVLLLIGFLFYFCFERNTQFVRGALERYRKKCFSLQKIECIGKIE
ncbi:hypothetical protein JWJ90_00185 [Desulfobulbus rhabdoformis]|uniref:hypothetical protein n=1 Tax=Desulfobulbus rhabdoformis TaxID=34032 RepID=UPI001965E49E|nr:hypothetical protein [Desulfobulbus rhabdoformis]MBM9612697.1 hypothetical protein [Desulfobulbus rhabdoformis]